MRHGRGAWSLLVAIMRHLSGCHSGVSISLCHHDDNVHSNTADDKFWQPSVLLWPHSMQFNSELCQRIISILWLRETMTDTTCFLQEIYSQFMINSPIFNSKPWLYFNIVNAFHFPPLSLISDKHQSEWEYVLYHQRQQRLRVNINLLANLIMACDHPMQAELCQKCREINVENLNASCIAKPNFCYCCWCTFQTKM